MRTPYRSIKGSTSSSSGGGNWLVYSVNDEAYQNWMFNSYPDFKSILIDWDRTSTWAATVDIYWYRVDALSWSATRTQSNTRNYIAWPSSAWTVARLVWWNFTFEWWEKIGRNITANFFNDNYGSGSWQTVKMKVTPSIYFVHPDWTLSEEKIYKQSWVINNSSVYSYTDYSDEVLTAQPGDKLVLKLAMEFVSWSWFKSALYNYSSTASINTRCPVQISVE